MSRIVAPDAVDGTDNDVHQSLHDHTYGITSDPLTQFACVFSALIHVSSQNMVDEIQAALKALIPNQSFFKKDADHRGVPNTQLPLENEQLAAVYGNRSVAE